MTKLRVVLFLTILPTSGLSDDFNKTEFERALNEALKDKGVTMQWPADGVILKEQATSGIFPDLQIKVPDYGIAAVDKDGVIKGVFGPSVPASRDSLGNIIGIAGYNPEGDTKFEVIGADQYTSYVAKSSVEPEIDGSLAKAINLMKSATEYIAVTLCSTPARPSEVTLNLSADFKLVFGASTGTSATWKMSETCEEIGGD
jgi:hypothetical protein